MHSDTSETDRRGVSVGAQARRLREAAGVTLADLADRIGCSKAHLSLMETGQRRISEERAVKIERALGIDDEQLVRAVRWAAAPEPMRRAVDQSRALSDALQAALQADRPVDAMRQVLAGYEENVAEVLPARRRIPVINKVAAGYPTEFTDLDYPPSVADEYVSCPDVNDPEAFAARVVGDSMEPTYREGEIIVFSPAMPTESGCDCFVRLERDNETTFKRVFFETTSGDDDSGDGDKSGDCPSFMIRLQPLNAKYPPRMVKREEVTGLWRAAFVVRKV